MTGFERLCAIRSSGKVIRWHAEPFWSGNRQDVAQHTFGVQAILCYICPPEVTLSVNVLKAALCHDLAEQAIGDIPYPTKAAFGAALRSKLESAEDFVLAHMVPDLCSISAYETDLIHAADMLDHCFVTTEQIALGNTYFLGIAERLQKNVKEDAPFEKFPIAQEAYSNLVEIWNEFDPHHKTGGASHFKLQQFVNAVAWRYLKPR